MTHPGKATRFIPMGVPIMVAPADGELANIIAPTFEWEGLMNSTTDGGVLDYAIQVDNDPEFNSPEVDSGTENDTSFKMCGSSSTARMRVTSPPPPRPCRRLRGPRRLAS